MCDVVNMETVVFVHFLTRCLCNQFLQDIILEMLRLYRTERVVVHW